MVPAAIPPAGERTAKHFLEFFAATIRVGIARAIYPIFRMLFPGRVIRSDDLARVMVDAAVRGTNSAAHRCSRTRISGFGTSRDNDARPSGYRRFGCRARHLASEAQRRSASNLCGLLRTRPAIPAAPTHCMMPRDFDLLASVKTISSFLQISLNSLSHSRLRWPRMV